MAPFAFAVILMVRFQSVMVPIGVPPNIVIGTSPVVDSITVPSALGK